MSRGLTPAAMPHRPAVSAHQARQIIVGLLKAAGGTLSYEQLDQQTDGIDTKTFDQALGDTVARGEVDEKDGRYTLLKVLKDQAGPRASSDTVRAVTGATTPAAPPKHGGSGQRARADEKRAAIVSLLTAAKGALPARDILEELTAANPAFSDGRITYVLKSMLTDKLIVAIGARSTAKYTTPERQAECEQHLAELQARDHRPAQHRKPGGRVRLATVQESPFAQAAIEAGQHLSDHTPSSSHGDHIMASRIEKINKVKVAALAAIKSAGQPLTPKEVFAAVKNLGAGKGVVQKALYALKDDRAITITGTRRGMKVALTNGAPATAATGDRIEAALLRNKQVADENLQAFIDATLQGEEYDALKKLQKRADRELQDHREKKAA